MNLTETDVIAKIQAAAVNGRIPCATAMQLAQELGLTRARMGDLLNDLKIKIIQCQLGCF